MLDYFSEFQLDQLNEVSVSVREKKYAVEYDLENNTSEEFLVQTVRRAYTLSSRDLDLLQELLPQHLFEAVCAAWRIVPEEESESESESESSEESENEESPEEESSEVEE